MFATTAAMFLTVAFQAVSPSGDSVNLLQSSCHKEVAAQVYPTARQFWRAAETTIDGVTRKACWAWGARPTVLIVYADGSITIIERGDLHLR